MNLNEDAYGRYLLAHYNRETEIGEIIERDDSFIDTGTLYGYYLSDYNAWSKPEQTAIDRAHGKILDIGAGAGRHALYLQARNLDVTAIDNSPGAVELCKQRGVQNAEVCAIENVDRFDSNTFDTILMLGNNFGLFGSKEAAPELLRKLARITTPTAQIIAGTRNPYTTDDTEHLEYHELNKERNRMPGQVLMRVRYRKTVGAWFDYLLVSPAEMQQIISDTDWQINEFIESNEANYFAIIGKKYL